MKINIRPAKKGDYLPLKNLMIQLQQHHINLRPDVYRLTDDFFTENTFDKVAMSYVFRPLTKNKYVSKNKNGIVAVLKKGRDLFPDEKPLISYGRDTRRIIYVSKVAALLEKNGVEL